MNITSEILKRTLGLPHDLKCSQFCQIMKCKICQKFLHKHDDKCSLFRRGFVNKWEKYIETWSVYTIYNYKICSRCKRWGNG